MVGVGALCLQVIPVFANARLKALAFLMVTGKLVIVLPCLY